MALRDAILLCACIVACRAPAAPQVHTTYARPQVSAAEPVAPAWADPDDALFAAVPPVDVGLPYDCRAVRPTAAWAPSTTQATAHLVGLADADSPNALVETPELVAALDEAGALDPASLPIFERVLIQNTALGIALRAGEEASLARHAWWVVRRFAASRSELEALGSVMDAAAEGWLGPRSGWRDRKGEQCGDGRLLLHDRVFAGARAFRPIRAGNWRALVAQLVAVDTEGNAHVTPFVGQIELRLGLDPDAPVCIVHLDQAALAGGAPGGLRRAQLTQLTQTSFVRHAAPGALACMNCHGGSGIGDFADVPYEEAGSLLENRRLAARELVEAQIQAHGVL